MQRWIPASAGMTKELVFSGVTKHQRVENSVLKSVLKKVIP
jgi:hypothetical protein